MKNKGCLIGLAVVLALGMIAVIGITKALTPWGLSDKEPRQMVRMFVCDPVPDSVSDINAEGVIAFAGGNAAISFRIDPADVEFLIQAGRFRPVDDHSPEWMMEFRPASGEDLSARYIRKNDGMTETALFISSSRDRCWFREIQY